MQSATGSLIGLYGASPIPVETLAGIGVPTTLIWGRHDSATSLSVAEAAAARYGWPLRVIRVVMGMYMSRFIQRRALRPLPKLKYFSSITPTTR